MADDRMRLADAILNREYQQVEELLETMTPSEIGAAEALHGAISIFDRRLIDLLLAKQAPMDTRAEHGGGLPFHQLLNVYQPAEDVLEVLDLLIAAGADINMAGEDDEGESYGCLRIAGQRGAKAGPLCIGLLKRGADPRGVYDLSDANALHLAARNGMLDVARFLLSHDEIKLDGDDRDAVEQTALHYAANFPSGLVNDTDSKSMVELLLKSGRFDIDARDFQGNTALHLAAARGNAAAVTQLLAAGANSALRNHENIVALDLLNPPGRSE